MNQQILSLCRDIDMPEEMAKEVANTPVQKIEINADTSLSDDPRGVKMLALHLTEALNTRETYKQKGISNDIYVETMKCFSRFVREHKKQFDCYGFDRGWWTWRQLYLQIFRLGALEFEIKNKDGKDMLSVHIPSDAVMTKEALDASYKWATEFFEEYFADYDYEGMYCDTWLLAPPLRDFLPENSKILNFMADYEILSTNPDSDSYKMWVYWKDYPDIASLPEDTSLHRAIKKHLLAGGKIGTALGRYVQCS